MKKKILLLAGALMMFMGIVSASSVNGDYKGNPIVKVVSNGKQLQSDEVPAQIYDGHTVVPISLLRQIGASVEWNADSYSVNVSLPSPISNTSIDNTRTTFDTLLPSVKQVGGKNLNFIYDEFGVFVTVRYDSVNDINLDNDAVIKLASIAGATDAQETRVKYFINNVLTSEFVASKADARLWLDQKITGTEFSNRFKINSVSTQVNPSQTAAPQISQEIINQINQAKCSNINRDYDKEIGNYRVEMGARGLLNSSMEINHIKQLNDERNNQLKGLGCATK